MIKPAITVIASAGDSDNNLRYNLPHETIGHCGSSSARRARAAVAGGANDQARIRYH